MGLFLFFTFAVVVNSFSCPNGLSACMVVKNSCPFELYLQRTEIDQNTVVQLPVNATTTLDVTYWLTHHSNRLYAWWLNPITNSGISSVQYADKVELNINKNNDGATQFLYNPTAVDYFGTASHLYCKYKLI